MLLVETYLDKSPIHGFGCYAKTFIPKGTVVWTLNKTFDAVLSKEEVSTLPSIAQDFVHHYGYYNEDDGGWVICSDNSKYFNHSDSPNTDDDGKDTIANRDIMAGEEFMSNYASFDHSVKPIK